MKIYNSKASKLNRRNLRNNMTLAEVLLWDKIRNRQINSFKFRRQVGIGKSVVDFYCPSNKFVIKIDGDTHYLSNQDRRRDMERDEYLEKIGCSVFRFTNDDIYHDGVLEYVCKFIKDSQNHPCPSLERRG